jgi:hypothetical protein
LQDHSDMLKKNCVHVHSTVPKRRHKVHMISDVVVPMYYRYRYLLNSL